MGVPRFSSRVDEDLHSAGWHAGRSVDVAHWWQRRRPDLSVRLIETKGRTVVRWLKTAIAVLDVATATTTMITVVHRSHR